MSQDLPRRVRQTLGLQNKSVVSIILTTSGDDQTFAFDRDDYNEQTLAIANDQAVGETEEAKNKYSLTIGSRIISLQQNLKPASIEDNGPGGSLVYTDEFAEEGSSDAKTTFENLSNSQIFDFEVIKGKADASSDTSRNYMQVLGELNREGSESEIAQNTDRILVENNRFSGEFPYVKFGQKEGEGQLGKVIVQNVIGQHAPKTFPTSEEAIEVQLQALKNLGTQIILKSSGEAFVPQNTADFAEVLAARAASTAPGLARLGIKVPVNSFDPIRVLTEANPDFIKPTTPLLADGELLSNGSYNNPLAPFDAVDSRSSAAAAVILVATIVGIFEALSRAFDPRNGLQSPLAGNIFNNINSAVIPTSNDYTECVREGLRVFFGIQGDTPGQVFGGGFSKFNDEPGYYNTILRSLTKMITYEIGQAAFSAVVPPGVIEGGAGPFSTNSGLDIQQPGLSNDITTNLLNVVRRITQSRVVGFMNVMANMGDLAISLRQRGLDQNSNSMDLGPLSETLLEDTYVRPPLGDADTTRQVAVNPASLIYKNYLSPAGTSYVGGGGSRGRTLAWGQGTTPSTFLLPDSIMLAGDDLGGANASTTIMSKLRRERGFIRTEGTNRLKPEAVEAIENELEASYVPFYFHDLRTNEIISFHAFLENVSDSFTAEYGESTGYGRIGKVYTYKNTDRNISVGFRVVAVSENDFETMWWKINKLITMVYPQYTAGRTVEYEGQKFIQPFSQLPSASPLVRLRLGDVFKSNYSKFNLARLFGLGQGQERFSLNEENIERDQTRTTQLETAVNRERTRMSANDFAVDEHFYVQYVAPSPVRGSGRRARSTTSSIIPNQLYALQRIPSQDQSEIPVQTPRGSAGRGASASSTSRREEPAELVSGRYLVRVVERTPENGSDNGVITYKVRIDGAVADQSIEYYIRLPDLQEISTTEIPPTTGANITVYDPDVQAAAESSLQEGETTTATDTEQNETSLVRDFFNSTENNENANPIFRAFESTKGRGLAGFIKTIKFDWNEVPWSVDGLNNRAPMMCKIELDFAPVHDLNPGIDSNGFNTAPIYRVGGISEATNDSINDDKAEQSAIRTKYNDLVSGVVVRGRGGNTGNQNNGGF